MNKNIKRMLTSHQARDPKFTSLIGAAVLLAIIFVSPSFVAVSTSAFAQNADPGRNITTAAGNMTGENTTSSSSVLHKPYMCLLVHCV